MKLCNKRENKNGTWDVCREEMEEAVSNSPTNPGRSYWRCPTHNWRGWIPTAANPASSPARVPASSPQAARYSPYTVPPSPARTSPVVPTPQASQSSQAPPPPPYSTRLDTPANAQQNHDYADTHLDCDVATVAESVRTSLETVSTLLNQILTENAQLRRANKDLVAENESLEKKLAALKAYVDS